MRHQAVGQRIRRQKAAVAWAFVVEGEPSAGMPGLDQPTFELHPFQRHRRHRHQRPARPVHRRERVARQQVQQVGEQQFLVLLFVLQAQIDQGDQIATWCLRKQGEHTRIDRCAPDQHLGQ